MATVLAETLSLVAADARALGCEAELDLARWIIARGTSADRQLALFTEAQGRGLPPREALAEVVDWLTAETVGANRRGIDDALSERFATRSPAQTIRDGSARDSPLPAGGERPFAPLAGAKGAQAKAGARVRGVNE